MPGILRSNDSVTFDRDRDARMCYSSADFMYPLSHGRSRKATMNDVMSGEIKLAAIKSRRSARPDERGVRDIGAAAINNFFTILMRTHHRGHNEFIINGRRVYSTLTNCTCIARFGFFTVMPILRETGDFGVSPWHESDNKRARLSIVLVQRLLFPGWTIFLT